MTWTSILNDMLRYRREGMIRDRFKSQYMLLAVTLRVCRERGIC